MADDLEQRIRERAYEIWENEGRPQGREGEHWDQACAEYSDAQAEAGENRLGSAGSGGETSSSESQSASPTAATPSAQGGSGGKGGSRA